MGTPEAVYDNPANPFVHSNQTKQGIQAKIISHRLLGSRVRVELKTVSGEKALEADLDKKQWNDIKQAYPEFVYLQ